MITMTAKLQRNYPIPTKRPENFSTTVLTAQAKPLIKKPLLDINANFAAKPVNTGVSKETFDLYRLRDEAAKELPYLRVCKCGKVPYKPFVSIDRNERDVKRYGNINHCGSVWTCPVCTFKKMKIRQQQMKEILKLHNDSGCNFYFVTLTIRHNSSMPLTVLLNKVTSAWRQITEERALKPLFKIANYIQTLEVRYSLKTGWHPHYHAVFMTSDKAAAKPLFDKLVTSWTKKTNSKASGQKIIEGNGNDETLAEYVAKMSLASELTEGQTKKSRKGDSIGYFEMLKDTVQFKKQIQEYGYATKHVQTLRKSRGLNITKDKDKDQDTVKENLVNIEKVVYKQTIVKTCSYRHVLTIADKWPEIAEYFRDYDIDQTGKMISPKCEINKKSSKFRTDKKPVFLPRHKAKGENEFTQYYKKLYNEMSGKVKIGRPTKKNMNLNCEL